LRSNVSMPGQPLISPVGRESGDYVRWFIEHAFVLVPAQAVVGQHLMSFRQFSPRQRPGSFSVEQAMEKLRAPPAKQLTGIVRKSKGFDHETE